MSDISPAALLVDADGNQVGIVLDGTVYRLQSLGKLLNVAGTQVNPATEDTLAGVATETKLELVRALLATIDADTGHLDVDLSTVATETKLEAVRALLATIDVDTSNLDVLLSTRATEATLAAADTKLGTIDGVLDSIKDTDGIKKITDELPAGTQDLGSIRLRDILGNGINSVLNNTIRRLEARSSVTSPDGTADVAVQSIDGVNHLAAGKANILDSVNSTVAQLGPAGVFAPAGGTDVSQFAAVAITAHSDQDSAVDGMKFEFSQDGTNWDDVYSFNLHAGTSPTRRFQFPVCAKYFRVNYTNGGTLTTELRIQTLLQRNNILTSIHRTEDVVREDRSAQLMKSALIAQREGSVVQDFYPIQADVSGNLKVTTIGTDVPSDPSALVLDFLKETGGSEDMRVDGSVTPVDFEGGPSVTDEVWSVRELLLTFAADDFSFDGISFGPLLALTNGISIKVIKDSVETEVFVVLQNEDFLRLPGRTPLVNNTGPKDVLGAVIAFQGLVLNESTSDVIRATVADNLTSVKIKYLTATLFAVRVI